MKSNDPQYERHKSYRRRYGITIEDYERMLIEQGGGCQICGSPQPTNGVLDVDHDHDTGEVRGLLCRKCNLGMGYFNDNPALLKRASEYILGHRV